MPSRSPPADMLLHADALQDLARDWITIWQSELAALAVDREAQERFSTVLALWARAAGSMLAAMPRGWPDGTAPHAGAGGAAATSRAAAAAAAPDAGAAEIERLAGRVAELERRLAGLERGGS